MPTEGTTLLNSKGGAPSASSSPSLVERVKAEAATAAALLLSVLFFMACSCSMLIVNKLALNALPLPFVVLTLQMAFAVVALCCAPCYLRFGSLQDVLRWCRGIPWLFAGMLGSSMLALNFASMAALVVVRNMGPLLALPIERAYQEKIAVSVRSVAAMVVILAGVVLYMYNDVTLDPANAALGLLYMFINLVLAIIHGLLTRRLLAVAPVDISSNGIVVLNNFCSLLPMAFGGVVNSNEWARLPEAAKKLGAGEWALIVASCTVGLGISWAGINVQQYGPRNSGAIRAQFGAILERPIPPLQVHLGDDDARADQPQQVRRDRLRHRLPRRVGLVAGDTRLHHRARRRRLVRPGARRPQSEEEGGGGRRRPRPWRALQGSLAREHRAFNCGRY